MFGPLYHVAAQMGIAADLLDRSAPHVVAMMLHAPTTAAEQARAESLEIMRAKVLARQSGKTLDVMAL